MDKYGIFTDIPAQYFTKYVLFTIYHVSKLVYNISRASPTPAAASATPITSATVNITMYTAADCLLLP